MYVLELIRGGQSQRARQLNQMRYADRPKPTQIGRAMPVFVEAPHVAAVLDNRVIEPVKLAI